MKTFIEQANVLSTENMQNEIFDTVEKYKNQRAWLTLNSLLEQTIVNKLSDDTILTVLTATLPMKDKLPNRQKLVTVLLARDLSLYEGVV
jgi:hypothetical protein